MFVECMYRLNKPPVGDLTASLRSRSGVESELGYRWQVYHVFTLPCLYMLEVMGAKWT